MEYRNDTICAISTPPGISGVALIRVSGNKSIEIVSEILKSKKPFKTAKSHTIQFGLIIDGKQVIDEVYVSIFKTPRSYTGEDVVEITCHGNTFIANQILELLLQKARLAEP
ncbi:MAG: tRNA uridine-5-carboxymethylaminomethyl(34) synthesis GTPase MnmE, partial [Candidatus Cloacimonetes bacterium]|nr:tRNA uridine-5-carboxymethylaminomethyl(34) synthesis GTPase MnmE [Candidatus Cloacimonadota bacterium]